MGENEVKIIVEEGMPALTSNGVMGDRRKASAEEGVTSLSSCAALLATKTGARPTPRSQDRRAASAGLPSSRAHGR